MSTKNRIRPPQFLKNISLVALSLTLLPSTTFILFLTSFLQFFFPNEITKTRRLIRSPTTPYFAPKTILVTGVGMSKGLTLARHFHAAGHNVIGADFEPVYGLALSPGRVSRAISKFYSLSFTHGDTKSYVQALLNIVTREGVHLWVSCSGVATAVEDGEAKEVVERVTECKAVQFDAETTKTLHEKDRFIRRTKEVGLNVPETHTITSKEEALRVLEGARVGRKFVLKSLVLDDVARGVMMTLLPRPTIEETKRHFKDLRISPETPWILQQYIKGSEYCTHALVIRGIVRAFVACPSSDLLMHYEALPYDSPLTHAMLDFTQKFAARHDEKFTGHLSFDFLVDDDELRETKGRGSAKGATVNLWPIECNPRAHTAVVLFNKSSDMVDAYLELLDHPPDAFTRQKQRQKKQVNGETSPVIWPIAPQKYYWAGHDFVTLLLSSPFTFMTSIFQRTGYSLADALDDYRLFLNHLITWKDGTFEVWDPWPWLWLYHIYWPVRFAYYALSGTGWSRINVSTGKVFEC